MSNLNQILVLLAALAWMSVSAFADNPLPAAKVPLPAPSSCTMGYTGQATKADAVTNTTAPAATAGGASAPDCTANPKPPGCS